MLRKVTISASYSGVLPIAEYSNARPGFSAQEEFEIDGDKQELDFVIEERQRELMSLCLQNYNQEADRARIQKIKNDLKDVRFYKDEQTGEEYPSVTSILGYDSTIPDDELKQYAAQGTINHARVADYISTGVWKKPQEIDGIGAELFLCKQGSLQLDTDACDFPAFLKKYPIDKLENGKTLISRKHKYAGTNDGVGVYNGLRTLFDIKRTPDKVKNFMQMAAYANCLDGIEQLMIIPLNDSTEQKFSKPILTTEISKYFDMFLYKRKDFFKIYGV